MTTMVQRLTAASFFVLAALLLGGCGESEQTAEKAQQQAMTSPPEKAETPAAAREQAAEATGAMEAETTTAAADPEAIMQSAGCLACHAVDKKKIGPAYSWVAHRYQDDPDAAAKLAKSVKNGSQGKWKAVTQGVPMPPNPQLSGDKLDTVVQWILERDPAAPPS